MFFFGNFWDERFVLIIFITMYYLLDRECDKKGVRNANGSE